MFLHLGRHVRNQQLDSDPTYEKPCSTAASLEAESIAIAISKGDWYTENRLKSSDMLIFRLLLTCRPTDRLRCFKFRYRHIFLTSDYISIAYYGLC